MKNIIQRFVIREQTGVARDRDLLEWGIPIRRGLVPEGKILSVADTAGREIPAQVDVQARWDDASAKWVLITIPHLKLGANAIRRLVLVRAERSPSQKRRVHVLKTNAGLRVVTDKIRFEVHKRGALMPAIDIRTRKGWRRRATGLDLRAAVDHNDGTREYRASAAPRALSIEVGGPHRALIRISGVHKAKDGRHFGPYCLRIEAIAGLNHLRCAHSMIFDGDPARDFIRASEIELKAETGGNVQFAFGSDDGREVRLPRQRIAWCPDFRHAELFQDSVSHWRLTRWVDRERRAVFAAEGIRSDGWVEVSGDEGKVATVIRDFWQNHPKSIAVDGATGVLRLGLYPSRAERLDLQRYSDLTYVNAYEAPCTWRPETIPFNPKFGAHGIRKTHDFALYFDEPNPARAALFFNRPLNIRLNSVELAKSEITRPAASRLNRAWLARVNRYLDFLGDAMLRDGGTGYVDYFDLPMGMDSATGMWHHDYGGLGYINDEALPCLGLWQSWFATGREEALRMALAMTRHNADIDSYHAGPLAGYGSRHNVNHWGDMCKEPRISQPVDKRFAFYLAGDRSIADLAAVSLRMWNKMLVPPRKLPLTAHVPALVSVLLFAEETGMASVRKWLLALAESIAASITGHGQLYALLEADAKEQTATSCPVSGFANFMMFSCFGGAQTFAELAERYDHQPLREALIRLAFHQLRPRAERARLNGGPVANDSQNVFRALDLLGYAYQQTGDPVFTRHARRHLRTVAVETGVLPQRRYGIRNAASRPALIGLPWPDSTSQDRSRARKYYPFFTHQDTAQFFQLAVYLHKLQGIFALTS